MKTALAALLSGLVLLFLLLGWIGGSGNALDTAVIARLMALRHSSPALTKAIIVLTQLGSVYTTLGATAIGAVLLWWKRKRLQAKLLAGTVLAERLSVDSIKLLYDRARPQFDLHPVVTSSSSYPSGHSANSMTAFVALALFAAPERFRRPALAAAIIGAMAIGMTRPFLGVHWPSDVAGGWTLAAMFLISARALGERLGAVEPQHDVVGGHRPPVGKDEPAPRRLDGE